MRILTMALNLSGIDIKQISVNKLGKVRIILDHKTFDEDGFEISSMVEELRFEPEDDVSDQPEIVQKICLDAWNATEESK